MPDIRYAQNENVDRGDLRMQVIERGTSTPIDDAKISISYSGDPDSTVEEVNTDASGMSETLTLDTPPLELSMQPSEVQPYAEYTIQVTAKGYRPINISGIEVFSGQLSLQEIRMDAEETTESMTDNIVIPAHTLFAEYPPKIAEAEIKPVTETGEIVLSRVVIPEYVIVHDGAPSDPTARDYYVRYRDYIKNVASSEIYSTWPDATIRANVLAIMSFTLNRVYTEWYRNKGYSFTITSSTAYDQKFMYGRNIYQSISDVVDEMFQNYLSRPNVRQPILTQYCDGQRVTCSNWLSQWGSKYLRIMRRLRFCATITAITCLSTRRRRSRASRRPGRESICRSDRREKRSGRFRNSWRASRVPTRPFRRLRRTESTGRQPGRRWSVSRVSSDFRSRE